MQKTSITETLTLISGSGKRKARRRRKRAVSGIIDAVARDANNATKLRAQRRAAEFGKSLSQVYAEAGVNHGYLSQLPKTGWRKDKLDAIATVLNWTTDELTEGADGKPTAKPAAENDDLMEFAIEIAVGLLRSLKSDVTGVKVGRLSRLIMISLQGHVAIGRQLDSESALIWGRSLIEALTTPSTSAK